MAARILVFFCVMLSGSLSWSYNSLSTINMFSPGTSQLNFTVVETANTLSPKQWNIFMFVDSSYQSLALYNSSGSGDDILSFAHIGLSYGLTNRLQLGIKGPIIFSALKDDAQSSIFLNAKGFTNIEGFAKYALVENLKSSWALMAQVGEAYGTGNFYVGEGSGLTYSISTLYEKGFDKWKLGLNLGYVFRNPAESDPSLTYNEPIKSSIVASVGLGRTLTDRTRISGELLLASHDYIKDQSDRASFAAEALIGFHTRFNKVNVSYGIGAGLNKGVSTPTGRGFLGFQYNFGFSSASAQEKQFPVSALPAETYQDDLTDESDVSYDDQDESTEVYTGDAQALTSEQISEVIEEDGSASEAYDKEETIQDTLIINDDDSKALQDQEEGQDKAQEDASENQKLILNHIDFDYDSAVLTQQSIKILDKALVYIKDQAYASIEIWGHTDFHGSTEYNEYLALQRAKAVFEYFAKEGVPKSVMYYDGFGERRPISLGLSDKDRRNNRRVEIIIIRETMGE